jgi:hypothetical protein
MGEGDLGDIYEIGDNVALSLPEGGDAKELSLVGKGPEKGEDSKPPSVCVVAEDIEFARGEESRIIEGNGRGSGIFFFPLEGDATCETGLFAVELALIDDLQSSLAFTWSISRVRFFRRTVSQA